MKYVYCLGYECLGKMYAFSIPTYYNSIDELVESVDYRDFDYSDCVIKYKCCLFKYDVVDYIMKCDVERYRKLSKI